MRSSLSHHLALIQSVYRGMEVQISTRQAMLDKLRRPFASRRLNRLWSVAQMNLTRNSGYYALVSSLMCLCLIGLRTNVDYVDEMDAEMHYSLHNWEPNVRYLLFSFMEPICIYPKYRIGSKVNRASFVLAESGPAQRAREGNSDISNWIGFVYYKFISY